MSAQVINIYSLREQAWQNYVEAAAKAQSSVHYEDGIAAGRAWRKFLDTFISHEQKQAIGGGR